jgi:hypothetical protein
MRVPNLLFSLAAAAVAATGVGSPIAVAVAAPAPAPAPSIEGAWKGPFLGSNFMFEFRQSGTGWTGRYQSEKFGKWVDLQDVSFADGNLRFSFPSQPPSTFALKADAAGKALNGSARFGEHTPLPLTLTRAS